MRVGVVGVGGMGTVHARKYALMHDVEMFAYDTNADKLDAYCSQFGAKACATLSDLLSKADAVDVCTPTDAHRDVAMEAIAAGKPTLVEKPMARTVEQCAELIDAAKKAGVLLMPGQVVRFFPEFAAAHKAVQEGKVGKPAAVRTRRGGRSPKGSDLWFHDYERSGGILLDLAVHDFDWMLWTIGDIKSVFSRSVRLGRTIEGAEFDGDYSLTTLEFVDGCVGHVETTWLDPTGFRATIEVCGSEGMLVYDSRQVATLRIHTADGSRQESNLAPSDDPFFSELRGFLDAVQNGTDAPVSPEDGMKAVAVALAAIESAKTGKAITL
ncbi:MAG: Gfo/Idh/MocA family oxidoreductase [Armatimonadetes bacterium]|nr:Gfo/Idh/MocA family oxidoreductase [Armatimonadota bacterium]